MPIKVYFIYGFYLWAAYLFLSVIVTHSYFRVNKTHQVVTMIYYAIMMVGCLVMTLILKG